MERRSLDPHFQQVTLGAVALACLMFNSLTSYNRSLGVLNAETESQIDLTIEEHRTSLLHWLNAWGCRHLSIKQHDVASDSIRDWYKDEYWRLTSLTRPLWQLEDHDLAQAAAAYGSLKDRDGAQLKRRGDEHTVHIGATAASKILFALRPESLVPWDDAMRKEFGCDGSPASYEKFLGIVRDLTHEIAALCKKNGFAIESLPQELGRSGCTVVALLNEYIWVTVSAECKLPPQETLARWAAW
ncbi:MAG: hypothetical protein KAX25_02675 [Dehalococcoidia bacterium]|nr:hypothetical protein [Dehalococcoidia bacterium]